jgi:hypothetical protein
VGDELSYGRNCTCIVTRRGEYHASERMGEDDGLKIKLAEGV